MAFLRTDIHDLLFTLSLATQWLGPEVGMLPMKQVLVNVEDVRRLWKEAAHGINQLQLLDCGKLELVVLFPSSASTICPRGSAVIDVASGHFMPS